MTTSRNTLIIYDEECGTFIIGEAGKAGKALPFYAKKWENGWKTIAKFLCFG
jgi:hypothetical protein